VRKDKHATESGMGATRLSDIQLYVQEVKAKLQSLSEHGLYIYFIYFCDYGTSAIVCMRDKEVLWAM
jgi:hypothetical protein